MPTLAVSADVAGPAVVGLHRPTLLLPPDTLSVSPSFRRAILEHEFAHISRRDVLATRLSAIVRALHWYNPVMWWAVRRLDLAAECACDDAVLRAGLSAREYAKVLVHAARPRAAAPVLLGAGFGTAPIVNRLAALASPLRTREGLRARERSLLCITTVLAFLPLAIGSALAGKGHDGARAMQLGPDATYTFTPGPPSAAAAGSATPTRRR